MLKKRLVGVITVKNGLAVQSMGYGRYLPLGRPERLAENLDRWGADEVLLLCIDRTRRSLGPDLGLLKRLGALGLSTPLAYGGGIRTVADAGEVIQCGAERVCMDAALRNLEVVRGVSALVGAQALIGALPLAAAPTGLELLDYLGGGSAPLSAAHLQPFEKRIVSEALVIDWQNEGRRGGFDPRLIRDFPAGEVPLIAFGGISEPSQLDLLLGSDRVSAVGVGNFLAYREHAIQMLKRAASGSRLRPADFATESR